MNKSSTVKRVIAVSLSFFSIATSHARAEESSEETLFLSLTRSPVPIDRLPSNIETLTSEEIKNSGAKTLDEVIRNMTGVDTAQSGTLGNFAVARLRGVPSTSQLQIFIDDQPVGGFANNESVDLSPIIVDDIERIEIVRGGSSILYGANTTGGVIHIFTKKHLADVPETAITYEGRSYQTHIGRYQTGFRNNGVDSIVTLSHYESDGFQENSDARNTSGSANLGYSFGNGSRIGFEFASFAHETGVPQGTAVPIEEWDGEKERAAVNPTKRATKDQTSARARLDLALPFGNFQAGAFGFRDDYHAFNSIEVFDIDTSKLSHTYGGNLKFTNFHGLTTGIDFERDEIYGVGYNVVDQYVTSWAVYVQQELTTNRLTVIPAVRLDRNKNFGTEVNPRLTAALTMNSFWTLSGNIARSFRAPSINDLYSDFSFFTANRNLKPESAWTYDLGNAFKINSDNEIKVTGYYTKISDRITAVDNDGDTVQETNDNVAKSELMGSEFEVKSRMGIFTQKANWVYQRSRSHASGTTHFVDVQWVPNHLLNYELRVQASKNINVINNVQYQSTMYRLPDRKGIEAPSHAVWNARINYYLKTVELFAGVNNILDKRYAETFDDMPSFPYSSVLSPMPNRNYVAGITLRLGK